MSAGTQTGTMERSSASHRSRAGVPFALSRLWSIRVAQGKQRMPQDLTGVYGALHDDLAELHAKWTVFSQLYATNEERVELLNASAPQVFRLCQDVFINDILITISRLTDPRQTSGKDNLSMERLVVSVDGDKNSDLKGEIERLLAEAKSKCQFARELRNRRLAHSDSLTKL